MLKKTKKTLWILHDRHDNIVCVGDYRTCLKFVSYHNKIQTLFRHLNNWYLKNKRVYWLWQYSSTEIKGI